MKNGYLVLESGKVFEGRWHHGQDSVGEVVFNTSHHGYEEIATDPSYFGQIIVMTSSQQGNYGVSDSVWESKQIWIRGFIALEIQSHSNHREWLDRLDSLGVPALDQIDTRQLTLHLRDSGTQAGALVSAQTQEEALQKAAVLFKEFHSEEKDWVHQVSRKEAVTIQGASGSGPKVALLDFGCKQNIIRELIKRCHEIRIFPSRASAQEVLDWNPDGVLLSNGPGNPEDVVGAVDTIRELLGRKAIFGICMGHQLLSLALGGQTYRLKFGHRGANHPIRDERTGQVYMTSQNHGYAVAMESLPSTVVVTHLNLNDKTVSGIESKEQNCSSVQFHPESHPGPREAENLFDEFIERIRS